ncbi:GT2 family glycosyltransferase [Mucilaginibacter yixingensis]|uniref:GT2 family glycosyltransferase n=1 Tax=Mucilaginibacter yixingensis TaxID=1295612 RepID=A0A2T5JGL3_9SPHI|nr:glycosyltransferase [Mucilaginibacter yixingensis]PTR01583.1 GT2 family glycosyltransferase [Mucilaginibacter yixingensis]
MKIAATVVTFNRLDKLMECITAIRSQSVRPDMIVVVNNSSTDNTLNWLNEQRDIHTFTQANLGSGGGQHAAMKIACELGCDWVWSMDDDGAPHKHALKYLIEATTVKPDAKVFNSIVLDTCDKDTIAFAYRWKGNMYKGAAGELHTSYNRLLSKVSEDWILEGNPQFFNSTFINKEVISQIGLPLTELFIRGDEIEFIYRVQQAGFETYTVLKSIMYHPHPPEKNFMFLGRSINYEEVNSFKRYYSVRNAIISTKFYLKKSTLTVFKIFLRELVIIICTSKKNQLRENLTVLMKATRNAGRFDIKSEILKSQLRIEKV